MAYDCCNGKYDTKALEISVLSMFNRSSSPYSARSVFWMSTMVWVLTCITSILGFSKPASRLAGTSFITQKRTDVLKIIFICELLYVVSTTVTKLSIAAYFLRLSIKRYQKIVIYTTLSVVLVFSTMYFGFLLFQCAPISYLWTKYENGQGHCLRSPILASVTYAHCAMSALTDWSFGILPIFFVWKMRMTPRTKVSVILVLSLGFL